MAATQCASFLTFDSSLTTLELAEQACSENELCSGVSDLYCNGMYDSSDFYALCEAGAHDASSFACVWEKPDYGVPSAPPPAPSPCGPENCAAPNFCHGDNAIGSMQCESISWTQLSDTQCAAFLPHNQSLNTLELAEAACGTDDECGGVSDLYCNGIHPEYPTDHYALCNGSTTMSSAITCLFSKEAVGPDAPPAPPAPPPPPHSPGLAPPVSPLPSCTNATCAPPAFCHGHADLDNLVCSFTNYEWSPGTQCVDFFPDNISRTSLAIAEAECETLEDCAGVSDVFCNGLHPDYPTDHYALCRGFSFVEDAYTCVWQKEPHPPAAPPAPPSPPPVDCTATGCTAPAFCHGTANPQCEVISYTQLDNFQCAEFVQPYDNSLTTLELAEQACSQACSANEACTGVSDLYCNGIWDETDHYALCLGGGHVPNGIADTLANQETDDDDDGGGADAAIIAGPVLGAAALCLIASYIGYKMTAGKAKKAPTATLASPVPVEMMAVKAEKPTAQPVEPAAAVSSTGDQV